MQSMINQRIAWIDGVYYSLVAGRIVKDSAKQEGKAYTTKPKPKSKREGKTFRDKLKRLFKKDTKS